MKFQVWPVRIMEGVQSTLGRHRRPFITSLSIIIFIRIIYMCCSNKYPFSQGTLGAARKLNTALSSPARYSLREDAKGGPAALALVMAGVVYAVSSRMPSTGSIVSQLLQVGVPIVLGAAAYCGSYWLLGGRELSMLVTGKERVE